MKHTDYLEYGCYYHVFNHAVGDLNLFKNSSNYEHFLMLYEKYIYPIADTFAWVLMPNHFHFAIRIRNEEELQKPFGRSYLSGVKIKPFHQNFSNMFNAYSKTYNQIYERRGSLFERPFSRKLIVDFDQLKDTVGYIHKNPVHHGFCNDIGDYTWSSYLDLISFGSNKSNGRRYVGWLNKDYNFKELGGDSEGESSLKDWIDI